MLPLLGPRHPCVALVASALSLLDCVALKPLCIVLELLLLPLVVSWLLGSNHALNQYYPSLQEIPPEILSKPALEFQIYSSVLQLYVFSTDPQAFLLYFFDEPFNDRD